MADLGFTLPAAPLTVGSYVPVTRWGEMLFLSGQLSFEEGKLTVTGKVPDEVSLSRAQAAAATALLNALGVLKTELGELKFVRSILRMTGYVASSPDFTEQHIVMNAASDLLVNLFGDAGRHSRVAVGVAERKVVIER